MNSVVDDGVWAALPTSIQNELREQGIMPSRLLESSSAPPGMDPSVWLSLPEELREELREELMSAALQQTAPASERILHELPRTNQEETIREEQQTLQQLQARVPARYTTPDPSSLADRGTVSTKRASQVQSGLGKDSAEKKDGTLVGEKLSFLSYNIWFAEEVAMSQRMAAIAEMIARYRPSFLALQEVTANLLTLLIPRLQRSGYSHVYQQPNGAPYFCCLISRAPLAEAKYHPFSNSHMSRGLFFAKVAVGRVVA